MEPKIRYARSADGVNIAYWAIGEGRPLVYLPPMPWCHIEREWAIPEWRRRYERLAEGRRLVRYDARGFGLSDPNPEGVTLAAHAADLEAVLDALAIDECDLFAPGDGGTVAIEFCARTPDRVGRLILWNAWTNREAYSSAPAVKSLRALWDEDWATYTETAIRMIFHWKHPDRAAQLAEFYRAAATQESVRNVIGALDDVDVTRLFPSVQAPTLVAVTDDLVVDMKDEGRRFAAGLPHAELRIVHGETPYFDFYDDADAVVTVVNDFLGGPALEEAPVDDRISTNAPSAFRTVLFTDLVGHTEMMSRLGDQRGRAVLREHERITRDVLKQHAGTEVKTMGDGFMASFGSVTKAVECAVALQRAFDARNQADGVDRGVGVEQLADDTPNSSEGVAVAQPLRKPASGQSLVEPLHVRVGLNAGEPIEEDGDLFGATVILASRIAARAEGGEILVADTVRGLCSGKGFLFADRGEFVAKGFEDPVRVCEVNWRT